MSLPQKSYLVSGGAGFIGSHLCDQLISKGHKVYVIDDLSNGSLKNLPKHENLKFFNNSILDDLSFISSLGKIACAFHLAAQVSVQESLLNPKQTFLVNRDGSSNFLKFCADAKVPKAILASSAAVYGDGKTPIKESDPLSPLSPYAQSKIDMEKIGSLSGIHCTSLRFFNVYGPRQNPSSSYSGVITKFFSALSSNSPLVVYGDGNQSRDFIYVTDVADALYLASLSSSFGSYNVGSGTQTSINSLISQMELVCHKKAVVSHLPPRTGDIVHSVASISKIKKDLGFTPKTNLFDGLKNTWNWFNSSKN